MRGERDDERYQLRQLKFREGAAWDAFYEALDTTDYAKIRRLMFVWLSLADRRAEIEKRLGRHLATVAR